MSSAISYTCARTYATYTTATVSGPAGVTYQLSYGVTWPCTPTSKPSSSSSTSTTITTTTTTTTTSAASTTASSPPTSDSSNNLPPTSTTSTHTQSASTTPDSGATSSIPTSSQTALPIHQHTGISAGATAGIAVGCVIAGLIIGLLAALLLFRRRKNNGATDISHAATNFESKTSPLIDHIDGIGFGAGIQLSQYLLDGAPDQDIVSEVQSLGELIRQHVEENYTLQLVDANIQTLSQSLQNLGLGSQGLGLDTDAIATLSVNTNTRYLGLRSVISAVTFASIDFRSQSRFSLLPGPVAGLLQTMPASEYGSNNAIAFSQALSTWRRLSAFLLHSNRSQRTSLQMNKTLITPQAQLLTDSLNNFLRVFVKPGKEDRQASHLQEVVTECARLGYVLFSHPVDWKFVFEGTSTVEANTHSAVVCPGLEKCSDRDGNPYRSPRRVVAPVEAAI